MVADHWFMQVEKVLEAMEVTSDTTRIRLAVFQLEVIRATIGCGSTKFIPKFLLLP